MHVLYVRHCSRSQGYNIWTDKKVTAFREYVLKEKKGQKRSFRCGAAEKKSDYYPTITLALLNGLRISVAMSHELWCRSQIRLRSGVAVAVV